MGKRIGSLVVLLAATALVAAGCGGDDDNSSDNSSNSSGAQGNTTDNTQSSGGGGGGGGGASSSVKLTADPGGALKFDTTKLTAKAGKVTVVMDNPSSTPHAVEVEGNGVEQETKTLTGGTAKMTVDLKPGKYEFYCPVDGHRQAGMEGTLTVQ
jgi:plastocyanin